MSHKDKKVLVISHNPLSRVNNNGKTLVSIFKGLPDENIYQIYLNADLPDYSRDCHYLQLNEKQILRSLQPGKNLCCQEVEPTEGKVCSASIGAGSFGMHTKRLLREGVWKLPVWRSRLESWLKDKQFDVVFFMAGDGLFAYDVYHFVMKHTAAKGCLFFTDDYIIGKTSQSPVAALRRCLLKRKIKKTLSVIHELYVISDEMKTAYKRLFGKDSYVIRNFSVEKGRSPVHPEKGKENEGVTIVYAGGLHYSRWKVLARIGAALKEINLEGGKKGFLRIYSSQKLSEEIIRQINLEGAAKFCGGATASEIAGIYAAADILLHVESFDKKAMASTMYSFSTKIPEYLSADKCVMAVGPEEQASLKYLSGFAAVAGDVGELKSLLTKLINDDAYRVTVQANCQRQYEKDFSPQKQKECLERILRI